MPFENFKRFKSNASMQSQKYVPELGKNPTPVNICYQSNKAKDNRLARAKKVPIDEAVNGFQYKIKINNFDWFKRLRQTPITNVYTFRVVFFLFFQSVGYP